MYFIMSSLPMSGMFEPSSPSSNSPPLDFIAVDCEPVGCFLVAVFFVLSLTMWRTSSKFSETLKNHNKHNDCLCPRSYLPSYCTISSRQPVCVKICEWLNYLIVRVLSILVYTDITNMSFRHPPI